MEKNITPIPFPGKVGDDEAAKSTYVAEIYQYACKKAEGTINWYLKKKTSKQNISRFLRFLAISLTTIGGLVPLIIASNVLPEATPQKAIGYGQFGYIALALAGACVFIDKFFGFSSGWMRYVITAMTLHRLRDEFNLDWAIISSSAQSQPPNASVREIMLKRVQIFLLDVMREVESETATWAAEYSTSLAELEKSTKQQLEINKPGVINLTVKNANTVSNGVVVLLDEVARQTITTDECQLSPVFPGNHFVKIQADIGGRIVTAGAPVRTEPGRSVSLTLSLPSQ
jgi:hypothetical protein